MWGDDGRVDFAISSHHDRTFNGSSDENTQEEGRIDGRIDRVL
jgi:hypothetical protein